MHVANHCFAVLEWRHAHARLVRSGKSLWGGTAAYLHLSSRPLPSSPRSTNYRDSTNSFQKALGGNVDSLRRSEDKDGILKSQEYFHSLVQAEVDAGIPADRVVLGGFSQGGAMSLFSGLTFKSKLAGIVGLSCWLPLSGSLASYVPEDTPHKETKIFLGHGDEDPLVPLALAKFSLEFLKNLGYDASLTEYR